MRASTQRSIPPACPGGNRVATSTAEAPAWLTSSVPPFAKTAPATARVTTSVICHQPLPMTEMSRSPTRTPRLTPTTSSTARCSRFASDTPRLITAAIGAKNGLGWSAFNSDVASLALTIIWIVGLVNAFNLMDNIDGATGTVGMVCAAGAGIVVLAYGGIATAVLALALCGACAGFLVYNLRRPSRVFLGDGGSMPIGFIVAAVLMAGSWDVGGLGAAAIVAVAPLVGLPILDTTLVLVSRARRGVPLLSGGRDHLTHRLLGPLGTPRRVAVTLAVVQAGLCGVGLALLGAGSIAVIATGIAYIVLGSLAIMFLDLSPRLRPDAPATAELAAQPMVAQPAPQDLVP